MEAILFMGVQGAGKSTFYKERFFTTHVRISLDLLKTRHREQRFLAACLETQARFVVDNTNPLRLDRARYIDLVKPRKYRIIGYWFDVPLDDALTRNRQRTGKQFIPERALHATSKKFEPPEFAEGFHELYTVTVVDSQFIVKPIQPDGSESPPAT